MQVLNKKITLTICNRRMTSPCQIKQLLLLRVDKMNAAMVSKNLKSSILILARLRKGRGAARMTIEITQNHETDAS